MTQAQLDNFIQELDSLLYGNGPFAADSKIDEWFEHCNKELDRLAAIGSITLEQYCYAEEALGF